MSVLALQLPPRERLAALAARTAGVDGAAAGSALQLPTAWSFVFSADERSVAQAGSAELAQLPRADRVVLVLPEADVAWHRVDIPRAPAARVRAALLGTMEEVLLDDDDALHLALAAGSTPGQPGWVAVTHKPRLAAALAGLEAAGVAVERVVAAGQPVAAGDAARGHFFTLASSADGADPAPWLAMARVDGAICVRLAGTLARSLNNDALLAAIAADTANVAGATGLTGSTDTTDGPAPVQWSATPAAATAAEAWLGAPVPLMSEAERMLEAASAPTNLRQFDLAQRRRGTRTVRDWSKRFFSTEWLPVRIGLAALIGLQLVGLNAYAWQQRQAVTAKRTQMDALLRQAHPGVRTVLDAPLQMQRETERLRTAAGRPGDADLEALLGAAAAAWPEGQGPAQTLRFEAGKLTLAAIGFGEPQFAQMRERLRGAGFVAEMADGKITVAPQPPSAVLPVPGARPANGTPAQPMTSPAIQPGIQPATQAVPQPMTGQPAVPPAMRSNRPPAGDTT